MKFINYLDKIIKIIDYLTYNTAKNNIFYIRKILVFLLGKTELLTEKYLSI
jgi:hypothetical protein